MEYCIRRILLLILIQGILGDLLDEKCRHLPNGKMTPHPDNCEYFVECYGGYPYVRKCGAGLHFNTHKGVCDYPHLSNCQVGPVYKQVDPYSPYSHVHREPGPQRENYDRNRGNELDRRGGGGYLEPTYEETVYGMVPGDGYSPPAERPLSSFPVSEMKAYSVVVMEDAKHQVRERLNRERYIAQQMSDIQDSKPFSYVSHFLNAKPYAKALAKCGMAILSCLKLMSKRFQSPGKEILTVTGEMEVGSELLKPMPGTYQPDGRLPVPPDIDYCPYPKNFACNIGSRYRTVDGTCNNLNTPVMGRSMTPFRRLLPPNYADGIEEERISVTGGPLPGARRVSLNLFPDVDRPHAHSTMFLVFWGQLLDHDMTLTAITEAQTDDGPMGQTEELRCGFDGCQTGQQGLEACWPIPIPDEDPDFPYNRCLKFVRSVEVPQLDCHLGPRNQLNQASHWLDSSMVYGNNKEDEDELRDFSDSARGRMAVTEHPQNRHGRRYKPLLPQGEDPFCRGTNDTIRCFRGGDERVNENSALCTMHTMLIREHNRLEQQLHFLNPHWDGERLFQETKRIVNAMCQHVTYHEFLPLVLGPELLKRFELELQPSGYYYGYDARVDSRVPNSFAAAAFRFGHTLLQEKMNRADENYNVDDSLHLSSAMNRPVFMYGGDKGGIDSLVRGLSMERSQNFDQFMTKQISRSLFTEEPPHASSMDLLSLNIMRGRDHGLPTYNQFRDWCGLGRAYTFEDLAREMPDKRARDALGSVYRHVDDIDLFAGGVSERAVSGGLVGPTFGCIIGETFKALRQGDRFWYENDGLFTSDQLQEIRRAMLSKTLCRNSDNVELMQPWIMLRSTSDYHDVNTIKNVGTRHNPDRILEDAPKQLNRDGHYNPLLPCEDLPEVDLTKWVQGPYTVH